jgi:hypothetical protein
MIVMQRQERRLQLRNVSRGLWADLVCRGHGRDGRTTNHRCPRCRFVAQAAASGWLPLWDAGSQKQKSSPPSPAALRRPVVRECGSSGRRLLKLAGEDDGGSGSVHALLRLVPSLAARPESLFSGHARPSHLPRGIRVDHSAPRRR